MLIEESEDTKNIKSREDFVKYIYSLSEDFYVNPDSWENDRLNLYLEALGAWANDMEGYYKNCGLEIPEKPGWDFFGKMLVTGKNYKK